MLGPAGVKDLTVLDLYAGIGTLGLESLRRSAEHVDFIERNPRLCTQITHDLTHSTQRAGSGKVYCGDVLSLMPSLERKYDVVFTDPPYSKTPFVEVITSLEECNLLSASAILFMEHSSATQLQDTVANLTVTRRKIYGDTAVTVYKRRSAT